MMAMGAALFLALPATMLAASSVYLNEGDAVPAELSALLNEGVRQGIALPSNGNNGLLFASYTTDARSNGHRRIHQCYGGMRIHKAELIQHEFSDGAVTLTGLFVAGVNADIGSATAVGYPISQQQVMQDIKTVLLATRYPGQTLDDLEFSNEHNEVIIHAADGSPARVAFYIYFFCESKLNGLPTRPFYIVDADSLATIETWEGLTSVVGRFGTGPGGNNETGKYNYGTDYSKMKITQNGAQCQMENADVKTVNMNHGTTDVNTPFSFTCPDHGSDNSDLTNGGYSPLNDAQYFGQVVVDMFKSWYGQSPLTTQLKMRVHYWTNYDGAFWNGQCMTFGDGHDASYPFVVLDVVAHEVSHGVTEQNSNLKYWPWGQSGGINEAFSDMAGKAAEMFMHGSNKDWGIAQDATKGNIPLRYMDDPPKDGHSIGHKNDYSAGMDNHHSSGVYNKAFYLLASNTAAGYTVRKAFDLFFCANKNYWTSFSDFDQGAAGVMSCARDLKYDTAAVTAAFAAVGIAAVDPTPVTTAAPTTAAPTTAPPATTTDQSSDGTTVGSTEGSEESMASTDYERSASSYGTEATDEYEGSHSTGSGSA